MTDLGLVQLTFAPIHLDPHGLEVEIWMLTQCIFFPYCKRFLVHLFECEMSSGSEMAQLSNISYGVETAKDSHLAVTRLVTAMRHREINRIWCC